jgi:hypothetical protein
MKFPTLHSQRLQVWLVLTLTSCVALIAHVTSIEKHTPAKDWVLAASAISLIISICNVIAHFIAFKSYVDQTAEGIVGSIVFLTWIASLAVMMRPDRAMAVGEFGMIINSNLYFFSWGSLMSIVYLQFHFLYNRGKADTLRDTLNNFPDIPTRTLQWWVILVTSIILMASAGDIHSAVGCTSSSFSGTEFCRRTSFAVALGALGMLFAVIAMFVTQRELCQVSNVEAVMSVILSGLFLVGVGFITFGEGPGVFLGNIYFSSWISFLLALSLAFHSIRDVQKESPLGETEAKESTKPLECPKEPIEPLEDPTETKEPTKPLECPMEA